MSRPVGARIIQACTALEKLGRPASYGELLGHLPGLERTNVHKYCQRAVGLRLMTVDRSVFPKQYQVLPDWRNRLGAKLHSPKAAPEPRAFVRIAGRPTSVWDLGATA